MSMMSVWLLICVNWSQLGATVKMQVKVNEFKYLRSREGSQGGRGGGKCPGWFETEGEHKHVFPGRLQICIEDIDFSAHTQRLLAEC